MNQVRHDRRARSRRLAGVLLAGALALASACGSDDDGAASEDDVPAQTDAGQDEAVTSDDASEDDAQDATVASDDETSEDDAPDATVASEDDAPDATVASEDDPPSDDVPEPTGTARLAPAVSLVTMDPHNFSGGGLPWLTPVYESLFVQIVGETEIEPALALDVELDGNTYTFQLREGVSFSDGEPFDADAVKVNLERGKELGVQADLAVIDSVEVVDEYTVAVTLSEPSPGFLASMASVGGFMVSPAAIDDPALDRNPVGTGPWVYRPDESTEGQVHVYTLNENYWNPAAQGVERIEVYDIPDVRARVNALKTGELDFATVGGPAAAQVDADPALALITVNGSGASFGVPILDREGTVVPALAVPEVREAMSLAIDREAFADVAYFGSAVPTLQPLPPGHWGHDPTVDEGIVFDPERARELLAGAGYGDGFDLTLPSIGFYATNAELLAEFWRDIGIDVTVEQLEPGTLAARSRTTDFALTQLLWRGGDDPSQFVPMYLAADATFNPFGVEPDPRFLELDAEGRASIAIEERAPAYQEMMQLIAEDLPVIYIVSIKGALGSTAEQADNPTVRFAIGQGEGPMWRGLRLDG